jgi:hypothetical protein
MSQQQHPLADKTLGLLSVTGEVLKRANAMHEEKQASVAAVGKLVPEVVQTLVDTGAIEPSQREKVASALANPSMALELLRDLAKMRNQEKQAALGEVVPSGNNAPHNPRSNTVGAPITNHDDTAAGQKFRQRIMHPGSV